MATADQVGAAELMLTCVKHLRELVDAELSKHGLSLSRAKLLGAIENSGPCHQNALATGFHLAPRTVTELIDTLERDGLVERRTDPADRRARQVFLTTAGREAHAHAVTSRMKLIEQIFGVLDEQQLGALCSMLREIDHEITNAGNAPGASQSSTSTSQSIRSQRGDLPPCDTID